MTENEYVPTTDEVLWGYARSLRGDGSEADPDEAERESHIDALRWLTANNAKIARAARVEALNEAAAEIRRIHVEERSTLGMPTDMWLIEYSTRLDDGGEE